MKKKIAPKNVTQRQILPRNMNLIVSKIFFLFDKQESNKLISQNTFNERKPINITGNKSKFKISKQNLSLRKTLTSKTMDNPIKNIIIQQQKALQTKKYINKRNISGLRKIPSTSICQNSNINRTLNNCSKLRIQLDDRKKKLISLKILKNKILNGNENQNLNCDTNINKKHGMNTMLNNYLSHKSTYSEMNSVQLTLYDVQSFYLFIFLQESFQSQKIQKQQDFQND